ncbi:MAG: ImmA/IrrE family metallo-endopeptidase [Clostridiaceae bacterium]|nr:ImmA/IrrE family metallo-endopeptidase [Clostridiaceae bacterium]
MNNYENLLVECEELGINVVELDFNTSKPCGQCKGNNIYINKNCSDKEKYCLLAEELGHYKTTYGNIINQNTVSDKKQEFKARRWGYKHIVSLEGIIEAFENNCLTEYEVAEYLGVTDEYFKECIEDYKKQYGLYCQLDKYHIKFEPRLGIYKNFEYRK